MDKPAVTISRMFPDRSLTATQQGSIVVGASLFIALCAHVTLPLPFTPVPLTLQNFGVLLVALLLGSRAGFAALMLYLAEGTAGLPVFNPTGFGGVAQLLGPTGGYLIAYPAMAYVAGWIFERGQRSMPRGIVAGIAGTVVLFTGGISWLMVIAHVRFAQAATFGLYPFVFAEVIKIAAAAAIANRISRYRARS